MGRKSYFAQSVLHTAGQSLQLKMRALTFDIGIFFGLAIGAVFIIPIVFGLVTGWVIPLVLIIISLLGICYKLSKFKKYYQGLEGERRTREEIEPIIKDGYHILNDVPGKKFNIDFLVIGPTGIYAIEVKNPKKNGKEKISYQDECIFLGSRILNKPDPIEEAQRHANWIKAYLSDIKNNSFNHVKPVVLFPKHMIEDDYKCVTNDIWILNPKRFRDHYLPKQSKVFSPQEVQELVSIFRTHISDSTPNFED